MAFEDQTGDPVEAYAAAIRRLQARVSALEAGASTVPVLEADPDPADPANLWILEDGRLCWRTADGTVHRVYPVADQPYPILTRSVDPAASTGIDIYLRGTDKHLRVRAANGTWADFVPSTAGASADGGGHTGGGSTSTQSKPVDTAPRRYRGVYPATWARSFCATHGVETTGARLRYGTFPGSSHGMRRIMVGLDDAQIRADLAGATVRRVELHVLNTDAWYHAGVELHFGAHNESAAPDAYTATRRDVWAGSWPESGDGEFWRRVPDWFGVQLRDGGIRGLTVHQPSSSAAYYGQLDWSSVRLAIVYTK